RDDLRQTARARGADGTGEARRGDADRLARVGTDLEAQARSGREQVDVVELGLGRDVADLGGQRLDLGLDRRLVVGRQGARVVLHTQVTDALQHGVHLVEGTLRRLHERDRV